MPVERFNDLGSPNGPVSQTGTQSGGQPSGPKASAVGRPSISQADGTASPRADGVVKSAALPTSPTAGNTTAHMPSGVQHFDGDAV